MNTRTVSQRLEPAFKSDKSTTTNGSQTSVRATLVPYRQVNQAAWGI